MYRETKGSELTIREYWMYYDWKMACFHPDIIKATSWQGIRSEVTDGEERLSRPIEGSWYTKGDVELIDNLRKWAYIDPQQHWRIPTPDPYEECAKEIYEESVKQDGYLNKWEIKYILKKYLQPKW
jgi:hypothetical protein